MAQSELWIGCCCRALMVSLLAMTLSACRADEGAVGMTLLFLNVGEDDIVVKRFDPDGLRGPVPGALGASSTEGKQMAFMPGDSPRGMPQFVEVEWIIPNAEYLAWSKENSKKSSSDQYSKQNMADYKRLWNKNPQHSRRIDLTPVITPELLAQVRADRQNTQLKLTITFNNDEVNIRAEAYKWRNR
jgi:hypothetical protein